MYRGTMDGTVSMAVIQWFLMFCQRLWKAGMMVLRMWPWYIQITTYLAVERWYGGAMSVAKLWSHEGTMYLSSEYGRETPFCSTGQ